jgi:hypothetical protein
MTFCIIYCYFYVRLLRKYKDFTFIYIELLESIRLVWILKFIISKSRPLEEYHLVHVYDSSVPSTHRTYVQH